MPSTWKHIAFTLKVSGGEALASWEREIEIERVETKREGGDRRENSRESWAEREVTERGKETERCDCGVGHLCLRLGDTVGEGATST